MIKEWYIYICLYLMRQHARSFIFPWHFPLKQMWNLANYFTSMLSFRYMTDMSICVPPTSCTACYILFHFIPNILCWLGMWRRHRPKKKKKKNYRAVMFLATSWDYLCFTPWLTVPLEIFIKAECGQQGNQSAAILGSLWSISPKLGGLRM